MKEDADELGLTIEEMPELLACQRLTYEKSINDPSRHGSKADNERRHLRTNQRWLRWLAASKAKERWLIDIVEGQ